MSKKISKRRLLQAKDRFLKVKTLRDLSRLLAVEVYRIKLMAAHPHYHIFPVKKKSGGQRWIEDPEDRLQDIQSALAFYLGTVYYLMKTDAAYGFVMSPKKDETPRNIATNAMQHLGAKYLYNADMKDFFHQIKTERIFQIFSSPPFNFDDELADTLARLLTNQGRLPMGAPTSPVLSNFASIEMDQELQAMASWAAWIYTRYADDLSFSSKNAFSEADRHKIGQIVLDAGFVFNTKKFKLMGPDDPKEITGVLLGDNEIDVPADFLKALKHDIIRLKHVMEIANGMGKKERWIGKFQQQVEGRVAFATFINGESDLVSIELNEALDHATHPSDAFGAFSWLDFGYF